MNTGASDQQIRDIQHRLSALGKEQRELTALLENLQRQKQAHSEPSQNHPVTVDPVTPDRIKLFMSLFRGRDDVFPKRWNNAKTGKSGYSPVCKNEWVKSVCNKPKIPCGVCTNQAFMPVTEDVIRKHLCGDTSAWQQRDYTIGVCTRACDEENDLKKFAVLVQEFDETADSFDYDALEALRERCTRNPAKSETVAKLLKERAKLENEVVSF